MTSDLELLIQVADKALKMAKVKGKTVKTPVTSAYVEGYIDGIKMMSETIAALRSMEKKK